MNHTDYVQSPEILDEIDQIIYIADMDTHELLFVNSAGRKRIGCGTEYRGKKCFEVLQGLNAVCPFCKNDCLKKNGDACQWDHFNAKLGSYFQLQDRQISFQGRRARIEIAIDVSEREKRQLEIKNALAEQRMLAECVRSLNGNASLDERISQTLSDIGKYYQADRAYVFRMNDDGKTLDNTFEWCAVGIEPQISFLQHIDIHYMDRWSPVFMRKEAVVEVDIEHIHTEYPDEYEIMAKQGIHSYMEAPLFSDDNFFGFIGVDNPDAIKICNSSPTILSLSFSVSNAIVRDAIHTKEQKRYESNIQEMLLTVPNGVGMLRFNLSRNKYIADVEANSFFGIKEPTHVWDTLVDRFLEHISDEAERAEFMSLYAEQLIARFHKGTSSVVQKYRFAGCDGKIHSVSTQLRMVLNPDTNEVEGIAYSIDLTKEVLQQEIFRLITNRSFDLVALVHLDTGLFESIFIGESFPSEYKSLLPEQGAVCSFSQFCAESMHHMDDETKAEYTQRLSAGYMLSQLDKNGGSYEFTLKETFANCSRGFMYRKFLHFRLEHDPNTVLVIESDETELQLKMREQLETEKQLRLKADLANEAKSDFLSRMSHDIRTPLNGIIGMTYLTEKMELPDKVRDNLEKINTSSKFLLSLVNDILDMTKMESKKIELHPEPYPYADFCAYIDAVIRPLCSEKNQQFILDTDPLSSYTPLVDITRLNRIYFNLLSNAVKYTPEGGTITLTIRETLLEGSRIRFTFTVKDNGIGMSSEFQKRLFEPFTQEERDDNSEQRGSGLGLAIVKKTVEAMNGTITVKSEKGKGSEFTVTIVSECERRNDLAASLAEKKTAGRKTQKDANKLLSGRHALLCEDHPLNQEIAKALLEEKGMIVQIAEDGQKGLEAFSESSVGYFDCILMDVRMPVMNGIDATHAIRSLSRDDAATVPIIAMTADAFSDDVKKCRDAGMNSFVSKPIEPDVLYRTLCEQMR